MFPMGSSCLEPHARMPLVQVVVFRIRRLAKHVGLFRTSAASSKCWLVGCFVCFFVPSILMRVITRSKGMPITAHLCARSQPSCQLAQSRSPRLQCCRKRSYVAGHVTRGSSVSSGRRHLRMSDTLGTWLQRPGFEHER